MGFPAVRTASDAENHGFCAIGTSISTARSFSPAASIT